MGSKYDFWGRMTFFGFDSWVKSWTIPGTGAVLQGIKEKGVPALPERPFKSPTSGV